MTPMQAIGIKIKHERRLVGMSQRMMAKRLDVSNVHLCEIENGNNAMSFKLFLKACRVLKIKPSELLEEIGR